MRNYMTFNKLFCFQLPNLRRIELLEVENMCNNLVPIFSNLSFLVLEGIQDITTDGVSTIVRKKSETWKFSTSRIVNQLTTLVNFHFCILILFFSATIKTFVWFNGKRILNRLITIFKLTSKQAKIVVHWNIIMTLILGSTWNQCYNRILTY